MTISRSNFSIIAKTELPSSIRFGLAPFERTMNALALVRSIVRLSRTEDAQSLSRSINGRVEALGKTHRLLAERRRSVNINALVVAQISSVVANDRVVIKGEPLELHPRVVQPLGLVLHDLYRTQRCMAHSGTDLLALPKQTGSLPTLLSASDGNHGLSVAAAAQRVGTQAIIFLPSSVHAIRTARIEAVGGVVRRVAGTYDEAVLAAKAAEARSEGILIPDTTQIIADPVVRDVMTGYTIITSELIEQFKAFPKWPTHAFIQAGVGGLAAAVAQGLDTLPMRMAVVEPTNASCLAAALKLGRPVKIEGNLKTSADMLSCGLASAPALKILLQYGATSVLVGENMLQVAKDKLRLSGVRTTESGAAGLAGLMQVSADESLRHYHKHDASSIVLLIISEAAPSLCDKPYASGDTDDVQV